MGNIAICLQVVGHSTPLRGIERPTTVSRVYNLLFKPEAFDAIRLGRTFHSKYQGWVRQALGDLSDEEINRLVCHVVPDEEEISKWRLSKLAIDMKDAVGRILSAKP